MKKGVIFPHYRQYDASDCGPTSLRMIAKYYGKRYSAEMLRQPDGSYRLDHAVTATQKEILKAFHMTAKNITEQANEINEDIHRMNQ